MGVLRGYFCHHKTASTWGRIVVNEVAATLGLSLRTIMSPRHWDGYASAGDLVRAEDVRFVIVSDPRPEVVASLPPLRGFHVIRDPRDILVSSYFSHRNSHPVSFAGVEWPELVPHRERLLKLDEEEGILAEMEFSGWMIDTMAAWDYGRPDMLEVRMEELTADPVAGWSAILRHLDLLAPPQSVQVAPMAWVTWNLSQRRERPPRVAALRRRLRLGRLPLRRLPLRRLPDASLPWALDRFSFERLAGGRKRGEEDQGSHYRRGVAGDCRNHLTPRHLAAFRERFGDLTDRLGYQP